MFRALVPLLGFAAVLAHAEPTGKMAIEEKVVEYREGKTVLEGFLAQPKGKGRRPAVILVHEWMGLGEHVKKSARRLAQMGYVAFAADIFGKGVRPANTEEAAKTAGIYKGDRALMRARAKAALDEVTRLSTVDGTKVAAMGYCFGGTTALELARSGAPIVATVSFHGGLETPKPEDAKQIKGRVLALHGADDPFVKAPEVAAFEDEMRKAGVDWQLVAYGGAVHSFTNPDAGSDNSKGAAYNASADRRSWEAMKAFFHETLDGRQPGA